MTARDPRFIDAPLTIYLVVHRGDSILTLRRSMTAADLRDFPPSCSSRESWTANVAHGIALNWSPFVVEIDSSVAPPVTWERKLSFIDFPIFREIVSDKISRMGERLSEWKLRRIVRNIHSNLFRLIYDRWWKYIMKTFAYNVAFAELTLWTR